MEITWAYKATDWMKIAGTKKWKSVLDPMSNVMWKMALVGNFEKKLQYGMMIDGKSDTISDLTIKEANCYFNHTSGDKTVGAEMKYDQPKKAFNC